MADKRRVFKVAERIQAVIARELLRLSDPRFLLVTVTSVVTTHDLRLAKVYFMVSGQDERREDALEAFESAAGLLRSVVGRELSLKVTPELRFYYDDTLDTQARIEELLARVRTTDAQ
jgi:ribosome-binding factor A